MEWSKAWAPLDSGAVDTCSVEGPITLFVSLIGESGFGECQKNITCLTALVGGGRIIVWGYFLGVGLGPLDPVKGNLNASVYQDIWPYLDPQPVRAWRAEQAV